MSCASDESSGEAENAVDATTVSDTPDTATGTDAVAADTSTDASVDATESDVPGDGCNGQFGCPCTENNDCESGWCIDGGEGYICTVWCIEDCPAGWKCRVLAQSAGDVASVCIPAVERPCAPCIVDQTCAGGTCLNIEGEGHCVYGCSSNADCEPGFSCGVDPTGKTTGQFCIPSTGSCSCRLGVDGGLRPCESANDLGVCRALETCHPETGWGDCAASPPTAEVCDGLDNDCDGFLDDGVVQGGPCETVVEGVGSCPGTSVCLGGGGLVCSGRTPTPDVCDGQDNDCDGKTDEDFTDANGGYTTDQNCGVCGFDCTTKIAHGVGACSLAPGAETPSCKVASCEPGYVKVNDYQCAKPPDTSCLACVSNADCLGGTCASLSGESVCAGPCASGADCQANYDCVDVGGGVMGCQPLAGSCSCTESNAGLARLCSNSNAIGLCYGAETCDPAQGWVGCTAAEPAAEVCDGLDNDCNGAIDEGLPVGGACDITAAGVGACPGQLTCLGGAGLVCSGAAPTAETCDYIDNDCDGLTDEGFVNAKGKPAELNHCGACNNSCVSAIAHGKGVCGGPDDAPVCVVESCDPGYIKTSAFTCDPPVPVSCLPCSVDGDCLGGVCTALDGSKVCLPSCGAAGDPACLPGYTCAAQGDASRCVPDTGSCACTAGNLGAVRTCVVSNPVGTCFGQETCTAAGWNGCTSQVPTAEVCNGLDDDCDFIVDETVVPPSEPCAETSEFGTCGGAWLCTAGWTCTAAEPAKDVCDYKDNNCNGLVDEDFRLGGTGAYVDYYNCGACGLSCEGAIPNALTTTCNPNGGAPRCEALTCAPGLFLANPLACVPPTVEAHCGLCQVDTDCPNPGDKCRSIDGQLRCSRDCSAGNIYETPEGVCPVGYTCLDLPGGLKQCEPVSGSCTCQASDAGTSRICTQENPFGTCIGVETCDPQVGWVGCSAGLPAAEICNGGDDDCNYLIDDVPGRGTACDVSNAAGVCKGVLDCRPQDTALTCVGQTPAAEVCNQFDDDCDGFTDEGYVNPVTGAYDAPTACGNCYTNCSTIFAKPQGYGVCDTVGAPTCKLACCKAGSTAPGCDGTFDHFDLNGVPDDGCEFKLDTAAIYVSVADPAANDTAGCGRGPTQAGQGYFPCRTIARGISEAATAGRTKVLVAAGLYSEDVTLVSGISLLGGYRADNWQRSVATTGSTIRGLNPVSGHAKAVIAQGITKATTLEGFVIYGASPSGAGANSYAVWISDSTSALQVKSNVIYGGAGGRGSAGGPGAAGGPGGNGQAGQDSVLTTVVSKSACLALSSTPGNQGSAGDGGAGTCGGLDVGGGSGAGADCPNLNDLQSSGVAGHAIPGGGAAGAGGPGGHDRYSNNCSQFTSGGFSAAGLPGVKGGRGDNGGAGAGCTDALGAVSGAEWSGGSAAGGGDAKAGGGGGGGGAGGGADTTIDCTAAPGTDDTLGGSGGGGGAGGCAGTGGANGGAGGGSFAVFVTLSAPSSALPVVSANTVIRGYGGDGGAGGPGGSGGQGGDGGDGGLAAGNFVYAAGNGGRGGQGGDGGHGGGGGGGCGGVSYGVYVHNASIKPAYDSANTFSGGGAGGAGGLGGASLGAKGSSGVAGMAGNTNF